VTTRGTSSPGAWPWPRSARCEPGTSRRPRRRS
jgi:hypothetical protein